MRLRQAQYTGSTLFPTNHLHYTTFFQANHSINHRNQLYFISVFIYTCIKVKLTEGEKEMAAPWLSRTISVDILFWLQKNRNPTSKDKARLTLIKPPKNPLKNPWIYLLFCSLNRRNYPRYVLSLRSGGFRAKESDFPHFPSVLRLATKKSVKSSIFK